jgi:hypothetical protein
LADQESEIVTALVASTERISMIVSQGYIALSIVVLLVIAVLLVLVGRKRRESRLTPLSGLAFAFVVAGTLFGGNRFIGYGLMAVGVLLAIADMFSRSRKA